MANLSNINNKFIVTDGGNGRVLIGATNDIGATLFANHPSTTAPSLTFNAPAGQVFENEDLQIAFGLNNASPYNGYMQTRFVSAPYYRNLAINPLGGNVGIGTNSPYKKLEVVGDLQLDASNASMWIKSGAIGTSGFINWTFNSDDTVYNKIGIDYDTRASTGFHIDTGYPLTLDCTNYIDFKRSGGILGRWNSTGLGIGTDSPSAKLEVNGALFVGNHTGTVTPTSGIFIEEAAGNDTQIQMYTYGGSVFRILGSEIKADIGWASSQNRSVNFNNTGTGNISVGIGTASPNFALDIASSTAAGALTITQSAEVTGNAMVYIDNNSASNKPALRIDVASGGNSTDTHGVLINNSGPGYGLIVNGGNVGIGMTAPSQKLEVTGNFKLNGTLVQEGTGNNLTYKYRTPNSNAYTGGNALCKFGRFYWTPAHWVTGAPVIKVTLHCKYYQGERREYIIKAGYQNTDPIINELQPSSTQQKITLQVGATTSAGYNYAGQPVYYVDLQWVQTAYIWGWAQIESQVGFLTSNPTSTWGGVVMDSAITQTNNAGTPINYTSFFPGRILFTGLDGKTQVHPDVSYRTSDGELFYQTSSERYKTNIVNLENCLDKVNSLRTVRFTDTNTNEPGFGLIAEETNEIIPEVVFTKDEQIEGISYSNLTPFLIKAIQELKAEIELLKSK